GPRHGRRLVLARESRELRGLPVSHVARPARLLDPGLCLTLRPMAYPQFFEMYRAAIKNTWTVEEVDFATDTADLRTRMTDADRHLVHRLVAFFATGDSIVANNLVLNLYKHVNAPEARMYLSRQLYEEALHVQFYLTLLDTYVQEPELFDDGLAASVYEMMDDAIECETQFAADLLAGGVAGLSLTDMRHYLEYVADQRLSM